MISLNCICGKKIKVDDKYAGKKGKCPNCSRPIFIPDNKSLPKKIFVTCEMCDKQIQVPEAKRGKLAECPDCKCYIKVPLENEILFQKNDNDELLPAKQTKNCKFCGEEILDNAIKCKHCGEFLDGRTSLPQNSASEKKENERNVKLEKRASSEKLMQSIFQLFIYGGILVVCIVLLLDINDVYIGNNDEHKILWNKAVTLKTDYSDESLESFKTALEGASIDELIKSKGHHIVICAENLRSLRESSVSNSGDMGFGGAFAMGGMIGLAEQKLKDAVEAFEDSLE